MSRGIERVHRCSHYIRLEKSAAMKITSTPTENKRFTARYGAAPIFMLGGAPRAHEVLSETGFLPRANFRPHSDKPRSSGVRLRDPRWWQIHCVQGRRGITMHKREV